MSKPRERWWGYALRMVNDYPHLRAKLDALQAQSITAGYNSQPGGGTGPHRSTEDAALRQLSPGDQADLDAVRRAINITQQMPTGDARLELIRLVHWTPERLRIDQAAYKMHYGEATCWRWHGDFVRLVAESAGLLSRE